MFIEFANKKIIDATDIIRIEKSGQDYLMYLRQAPPYELLASEYPWLMYTCQFLVEVQPGLAINYKEIRGFSGASVFLKDGTDVLLSQEKFDCLKADHCVALNLAERIDYLQGLKQENPDIDENNYKKIA